MHLTNPFIELGRRQGIEQGIQQGMQQGIRQGIEKGRHEGEMELVLRQLSRRLGPVSMAQKRLIRSLDLPQIEALGESLLGLKSRADLGRWLKKDAL